MFQIRFCFLLLVVFAHHIYSQSHKEANIWYFGVKQGLDFNSGAPVVLSNTNMYAGSGSSVICDASGNLLFYTNGQNVYDKTHNTMPNGSGLTAGSNAQVIIVPQPGTSLYYFFYNVKWGTGPLYYCIVDMSLNGGNGDVTVKNSTLVNPSTEKVAAIENASGNGYWLVAHKWKSDEFYAYEITSTGLNTTPVISKTGSMHTGNTINAQGDMKISPDGKKLALAIQEDNKFELFDFNNSTGLVSNPITISPFIQAFSMEFSPDSKLLYTVHMDWNIPSYEVNQFDLSNTTSASLKASKVLIDKHDNYYGSMQLGPDCKIYLIPMKDYTPTVKYSLDVINEPNKKGVACNYQNDAVLLGSLNSAGTMLPKFVTTFLNAEKCSFNVSVTKTEVKCNGDSTGSAKVLVNGGTPPFVYSWAPYGGSDSIANGLAAGTYTVTVADINTNITTQEIIIKEPQEIQMTISPSSSVVICSGDTIELKAGVTGGAAPYKYIWNPPGITDSSISVSPVITSVYSAEVTDTNGCKILDSILVTVSQNVTAIVSKDTTICLGDSVVLLASGGSAYNWQPGSGISNVNSNAPQVFPAVTTVYTVVVSSGTCKPDTEEIKITVLQNVSANAGPDKIICEGQTTDLMASGGTAYLWSTGENTDKITVKPVISATYFVEASVPGCGSDTDSVFVKVNPLPLVSVILDDTIEAGDEIILFASGGTTYSWTPITELSNPLTESPLASPTVTTTYTVVIADSNGCSVIRFVTVYVKNECENADFFLPNAFSPNGDGMNDNLELRTSNLECILNYHLTIFNRWGEKLFESEDPLEKWNGKYNGMTLDATVLNYTLYLNFTDGSIISQKGTISIVK